MLDYEHWLAVSSQLQVSSFSHTCKRGEQLESILMHNFDLQVQSVSEKWMRARTRSKQIGSVRYQCSKRTLIMHFYQLQPKRDAKLAKCISLIPHVMHGKRKIKK